ncbi:MAG TPA: hypothetical protein VJ837_01050 [Candidatus Paceibacterota bacterium]|nr:hypothetical protein [Candidatus Paceibacterota bacterium]
MTVRVFNLATGTWVGEWTCTPREAVIAAHAQSLGDYNTWDYEERYGSLVVNNKKTVRVGDYTAEDLLPNEGRKEERDNVR